MHHRAENGFSLIELLVAMALASIVGLVIATAYEVQVRGKNTQEALTDMNQSARAALEIMADDIAMAGLDPTEDANARIILADAGELIFSTDRGDGATNRPDGDCCDNNEIIQYHLTNDNDDDGVNDLIADGVACDLGRQTGGGIDPGAGCGNGLNGLLALSPNVDALNFVYLDDDGAVIATPVANPGDIRSIQVTLVVRAGVQSGGFIYRFANNQAYANQQGDEILPAQGDRFRRLLLTTTINCRNLGV
jgi:type IV pilus assembly protein PilW